MDKSIDIMEEVWKDIPGFEGMYQCSDIGNVKGLDRLVPCGKKTNSIKGQIIKPKIDRYGYPHLHISKDSKKFFFTVHRLVASTFIENKENKPQVNHINGIKTDNRIENLEWCNNSENILHSFRCLGREKPKGGGVDIDNKMSKPLIQYDLNGNFIKQWNSRRGCSRELGIDYRRLSDFCLGLKKSKNFIFKDGAI